MKKILSFILIALFIWTANLPAYANIYSIHRKDSSQLTSSIERVAALTHIESALKSSSATLDIPEELFPKLLIFFSDAHPQDSIIDNFGEIYKQTVIENRVVKSKIYGYYFRVAEGDSYFYYYVEIVINQQGKATLLPVTLLNEEKIADGLPSDELFQHIIRLKTSLRLIPCVGSDIPLPKNTLKAFAKKMPLGNLLQIYSAKVLKETRSWKQYRERTLEVKVEYRQRNGLLEEDVFKLIESRKNDNTKDYYDETEVIL